MNNKGKKNISRRNLDLQPANQGIGENGNGQLVVWMITAREKGFKWHKLSTTLGCSDKFLFVKETFLQLISFTTQADRCHSPCVLNSRLQPWTLWTKDERLRLHKDILSGGLGGEPGAVHCLSCPLSSETHLYWFNVVGWVGGLGWASYLTTQHPLTDPSPPLVLAHRSCTHL